MKLDDVLKVLNIDLNNHYLGNKCSVMTTYYDKIDVLAYCQTYTDAMIIFVRGSRACAFLLRMIPTPGSLHDGFRPITAGVSSSWCIDIGRMTIKKKEDIEAILTHMRRVGDHPLGTCFEEDYAEEKLYAEGKIMPKKKFLGEVVLKKWSKDHPRKSGNLYEPLTPVRHTGDPFPFDRASNSRGGNRENTQLYGFFLCKNGNVIVYERYGSYGGNTYTKAVTGDEFPQGPGTMVNLHNALIAYERAAEGQLFCNIDRWHENIYEATKSFELPDEAYDKFRTQVLCKELDGAHSTYMPKETYWIPKQ